MSPFLASGRNLISVNLGFPLPVLSGLCLSSGEVYGEPGVGEWNLILHVVKNPRGGVPFSRLRIWCCPAAAWVAPVTQVRSLTQGFPKATGAAKKKKKKRKKERKKRTHGASSTKADYLVLQNLVMSSAGTETLAKLFWLFFFF